MKSNNKKLIEQVEKCNEKYNREYIEWFDAAHHEQYRIENKEQAAGHDLDLLHNDFLKQCGFLPNVMPPAEDREAALKLAVISWEEQAKGLKTAQEASEAKRHLENVGIYSKILQDDEALKILMDYELDGQMSRKYAVFSSVISCVKYVIFLLIPMMIVIWLAFFEKKAQYAEGEPSMSFVDFMAGFDTGSRIFAAGIMVLAVIIWSGICVLLSRGLGKLPGMMQRHEVLKKS